jgi:hypothetical protein
VTPGGGGRWKFGFPGNGLVLPVHGRCRWSGNWNLMFASPADIWQTPELTMQKPNYQFEKRRKELDKKAKKEAKRRQKLESNRSAHSGDPATPSSPVEPA